MVARVEATARVATSRWVLRPHRTSARKYRGGRSFLPSTLTVHAGPSSPPHRLHPPDHEATGHVVSLASDVGRYLGHPHLDRLRHKRPILWPQQESQFYAVSCEWGARCRPASYFVPTCLSTPHRGGTARSVQGVHYIHQQPPLSSAPANDPTSSFLFSARAARHPTSRSSAVLNLAFLSLLLPPSASSGASRANGTRRRYSTATVIRSTVTISTSTRSSGHLT